MALEAVIVAADGFSPMDWRRGLSLDRSQLDRPDLLGCDGSLRDGL